MSYGFNKGVVRDGLRQFKMNRNINNVYFDLSHYTTESPPTSIKSRYDEKIVHTIVYEISRRFIDAIEDLIKIHQLPKSFLLITVIKGEYITNDMVSTTTIHYTATNISVPPNEASNEK